jgi:hypothetical protein
MLVVLQHLLLPIPKVWSIFVDDILCWTKLVSFVKSEVWMHYIYIHICRPRGAVDPSKKVWFSMFHHVSTCWFSIDYSLTLTHQTFICSMFHHVWWLSKCVSCPFPATFEAIFSRLELADLVEVPGQRSRLDVENFWGYTPCWLFNSLLCQMAHVSMNYDGFL